MIKKAAIILITIVVLFSLAELSFSADTDNHEVTVDVVAINAIVLNGGNITLMIDTATPGVGLVDAIDGTCSLDWTTNEANRKITVQTTTAVGQKFGLTVEATNVTGVGASSGVITLTDGDPAQDFVTGVSQTVGDCTLSYTASATVDQGFGSDIHTVVYTLTN